MTYQVPITQKYCTFTDVDYNPTYIGHLQKEYEELRNNGMSFMEAMDKLNIKRICCRETLFNPPFLFLNDEESSRLIDKAGILTKSTEARIKQVETIESSDPIIPKKPVPVLPK